MKIRFLAILTATLLVALPARAQTDVGMDINVRSGVDNAEQARRDQDPAYAKDPAKRLRVYFLARVQEEKTEERLVKPVDAVAIAQELTCQLAARGFRPVQPSQKPEMVITVKYGRGFVSNPYLDSSNILFGDLQKQHTNLSNSDPVSPWLMHDNFVGLEEKRQRARYEKLMIQVRAWKYPPPPDPKQKTELLWATTMYVDDPQHRDLNTIAAKMLETGAPFFDQHIGVEHEVVINTAMPEGRVKVGSPEVLADPKSK